MPLSFINRGEHQGLDPSEDVALLTADSGLVHVRWKVSYKIEKVVDFVTRFAGNELEAAERILRPLVETTAVHLATQMTAGEFIRTRLTEVQEEMRSALNRRLAELGAGIHVTLTEMFEPTPPLQIRGVFDNTQRAENAKQRRIQDAEQQRTKILSEAAGASYRRLIDVLDRLESSDVRPDQRLDLRSELNRMLEKEVEGKAGRMIRDAGSYHAVVVSQIQNDLEEYRTLLPEYERNASLLFARLRERTLQEIFQNSAVVKLYRPRGVREFRLVVPLDPEQTRQQEVERIQRKDTDVSRLRPPTYHPMGPDTW
jgi:regulator of protease activity HflC (stomatin/prohibitin superfamily)